MYQLKYGQKQSEEEVETIRMQNLSAKYEERN